MSTRTFRSTCRMDRVTARKRKEQQETGAAKAAAFGITSTAQVFTTLSSIFKCADWQITAREGQFTAEARGCMLCRPRHHPLRREHRPHPRRPDLHRDVRKHRKARWPMSGPTASRRISAVAIEVLLVGRPARSPEPQHHHGADRAGQGVQGVGEQGAVAVGGRHLLVLHGVHARQAPHRGLVQLHGGGAGAAGLQVLAQAAL